MNELTNSLFSTEAGKKLYQNSLSAIKEFGMHKLICDGVLVGLSGGADSVALLLVLIEYRKEYDFKIKAVHINHCIRGEEADFDEAFSRNLCDKLKVDFESYKIDVPELAKEEGKGLEEAARDIRYKKFNEIISSDALLSSIAVAHNATDNLETVIFNMMRGSGIAGISGIRPVRDNVIRPLIFSSKELICEALSAAGIEFVVDSTNLSTEYTRNYIRNEILPKLKKISDSPERMCTRLTQSLREDSDYLFRLAEDFLGEHEKNGVIAKEEILTLDKPVFSRVLMLMCKNKSLPAPEKVHIDSVFSLLQSGDFSVSIPGNKKFVSESGNVYIGDFTRENNDFCFDIKEGVNTFPGFESIIILSKDKNDDCFSNIYKKSIQVKIKFDIINNGLFIRSKKDGDAYRFDNMTRKLKKLFNDRKVSLSDRKNIPIFCDKAGILWIPGFKVRDEISGEEDWYITIMNPIEKQPAKRYFAIANN